MPFEQYLLPHVQIGKPVDGLVELVRQCIQRCAIDNRKDLFRNICVVGTYTCSVSEVVVASHRRPLTHITAGAAGGGAALPGLAERLKFELAQVRTNRPIFGDGKTHFDKNRSYLHIRFLISDVVSDV